MKSTKTNKGITLIALIITIVVLLILAVVAISSITNDGILHYAQNAADSWNKASQNEAGIIDGYLDYLNNLNNQTCNHTWEVYDDDECYLDNYHDYIIMECSNCGMVCRHETAVLVKAYLDDELYGIEAGHNLDYLCPVCGAEGYDCRDHEWNENSVCTVCEYVCEHDFEDSEWECTDEGHQGECSYCYRTIIEAHDYEDKNSGQNCLVCGYDCEHTENTKYYDNYMPGYHILVETCVFCGCEGYWDDESCTYVDGKCTLCGGSEG